MDQDVHIQVLVRTVLTQQVLGCSSLWVIPEWSPGDGPRSTQNFWRKRNHSSDIRPEVLVELVYWSPLGLVFRTRNQDSPVPRFRVRDSRSLHGRESQGSGLVLGFKPPLFMDPWSPFDFFLTLSEHSAEVDPSLMTNPSEVKRSKRRRSHRLNSHADILVEILWRHPFWRLRK